MKKYTKKDFNKFEVNINEYKICPTGDYTNIDSFVDKCRFDRKCLFSNIEFYNKCIFWQ